MPTKLTHTKLPSHFIPPNIQAILNASDASAAQNALGNSGKVITFVEVLDTTMLNPPMPSVQSSPDHKIKWIGIRFENVPNPVPREKIFYALLQPGAYDLLGILAQSKGRETFLTFSPLAGATVVGAGAAPNVCLAAPIAGAHPGINITINGGNCVLCGSANRPTEFLGGNSCPELLSSGGE